MYNTIDDLNYAIRSCHNCSLCDDANNKVVISKDKGNPPVNLMIIGEASGRKEAESGLPFIGSSGKLLDQWIELFNLDSYVVVNVVKNRPTNEDGSNRSPPSDEEIKACFPWLENQIELYKPRRILCLGACSFKAITNSEEKISEVVRAAKTFTYKGIPVSIYFHPAYIRRHPKHPWKREIGSFKFYI